MHLALKHPQVPALAVTRRNNNSNCSNDSLDSYCFFFSSFPGKLKLHQTWWAPGVHQEAGRPHPAEGRTAAIHTPAPLPKLAGPGCRNCARGVAASQSRVQCGQRRLGLLPGLCWLHQCHVRDTAAGGKASASDPTAQVLVGGSAPVQAVQSCSFYSAPHLKKGCDTAMTHQTTWANSWTSRWSNSAVFLNTTNGTYIKWASEQTVVYVTGCCEKFHVVSASVSPITITSMGETQKPSGCGPWEPGLGDLVFEEGCWTISPDIPSNFIILWSVKWELPPLKGVENKLTKPPGLTFSIWKGVLYTKKFFIYQVACCLFAITLPFSSVCSHFTEVWIFCYFVTFL